MAETLITAPMQLEERQAVRIYYKNWKGEYSWRMVIPLMGSLRFGTTEWHLVAEWLFQAYDLDKQAWRDFALTGVLQWHALALPTTTPS